MGIFAALLQVICQLSGGEPLVFRNFIQQWRLPHTDQVSRIEDLNIILLEDIAHAGIGAGFEDCYQPLLRVGRSHGSNCFAHCCGMMGEIVHHADAVFHPAQFLASLDAFKCLQGLRNNLTINPDSVGRCDYGQGIEQVMVTDHVQDETAIQIPILEHFKPADRAVEFRIPQTPKESGAFP